MNPCALLITCELQVFKQLRPCSLANLQRVFPCSAGKDLLRAPERVSIKLTCEEERRKCQLDELIMRTCRPCIHRNGVIAAFFMPIFHHCCPVNISLSCRKRRSRYPVSSKLLKSMDPGSPLRSVRDDEYACSNTCLRRLT